ncbi:MAG: hypothetical protein U5L96_05855 [Owenweeksia sp.]|nr:hypothetical protein [Owenweeksia sp.]
MKPAHLIYLFTLVYFSLLTSCTGPVDDSSDENEQNDSTTTGAINFGKAQPANAGPNGIVMHEVLNTKYGIVGGIHTVTRLLADYTRRVASA